MPVLLVDDDQSPTLPAWVPGSPGASVVTQSTGSGGAVFVDDLLDYYGAWASASLYADNIAVTATFDADNSRVRLTATGLEPFTLVRFERSTNQIVWTTVRGGVAVSVASGSATLDDYEFVAGVVNYYRVVTLAPFGQTSASTTITPTLTQIWLKSLTRPFLNRVVTVVGFTDPTRPGRSNENAVVSRTLPVAVNDIRTGRRWSITVYTATDADAQTFDYILASGDVMLLHTPLGCEVPGGYVQIKDYAQRHPSGRVHGHSRVFTLPLVEVAPPAADVAAAIGTWASVLANFATWQAVLDAFPTWSDLLAYKGSPSEVIVS